MPLSVRLVGAINHIDFADAMEQICADARVVGDREVPELIVLAQSRPGAISAGYVQGLRRDAPLAGMVGLLGSWCEGETRTGRPWPNVARVYWYEFPSWWYLQLKRRAAGLCPEWSRLGDFGLTSASSTRLSSPNSVKPRMADFGLRNSVVHRPGKPSQGVILLRTAYAETARALADVFRRAGYATAWQRARAGDFSLRGALAGVWDGAQLDDREADDLGAFCKTLARDVAPVVALLDFPRRDNCDRALRCGAASALGKPWRNDQLLAAIEIAVAQGGARRAA
jgi:hypothetical protein